MGSVANGNGALVSKMLGEIAERANHDSFMQEFHKTGSDLFIRPYSDGFADGFRGAAETFGASSSTVGDFLLKGSETKEAQWRFALAVVEFDVLGPVSAQSHEPARHELARSERSSGPTRYVAFQYCVSLGIVSFKRSSGIKAIAPGSSVMLAGLPYTLISLIAGWWGIPWGPIWTLETIARNLGGGIDLTAAVEAGGNSVARVREP
jgi:hypothetical protein